MLSLAWKIASQHSLSLEMMTPCIEVCLFFRLYRYRRVNNKIAQLEFFSTFLCGRRISCENILVSAYGCGIWMIFAPVCFLPINRKKSFMLFPTFTEIFYLFCVEDIALHWRSHVAEGELLLAYLWSVATDALDESCGRSILVWVQFIVLKLGKNTGLIIRTVRSNFQAD